MSLSDSLADLVVGKLRGFLPASRDLLGAPADNRKYLAYLWQQRRHILGRGLKKFTRYFRRRFHRTGDCDKVKPGRLLMVAANKYGVYSGDCYSDYLRGVKKRSQGEYGIECIEKPGDTEFKELYTRYRLSWNGRHRRRYFRENVTRFVLHFKAWLRCRELREAVLVAEYGARLPDFMPEPGFRHLAILAQQDAKAENQLPVRVSSYSRRRLMNLHSYAITPEGADRLIENARQQLLPPLHEFMGHMLKKLDVVYYPLVPCQLADEVLARVMQGQQQRGEPPQEMFWAN